MEANSNDVFAPILRMDIVLLPHNSIVMEAEEEPYLSLMKDMIQEEGEFAVFYEDEQGINEFGCLAFVEQYEYDAEKLICKITGTDRVEAKTVIPSERIGTSLREIADSGISAEEMRNISLYDFVDGVLVTDDEEEPDSALREKLFVLIEAAVLKINPDFDRNSLQSWFNESGTEDFSFKMMNGLVTENSPELNQIRLQILQSKSENSRLQMIQQLFSEQS